MRLSHDQGSVSRKGLRRAPPSRHRGWAALFLTVLLVAGGCAPVPLEYTYGSVKKRPPVSAQAFLAKPSLRIAEVRDMRSDRAIDGHLVEHPEQALTTILRREIASTGAFSEVVPADNPNGGDPPAPNGGDPPADSNALPGPHWALEAQLLEFDWHMPYFWVKKIGSGVVGLAFGWAGALVSIAMPTTVSGESKMRLVVRDLDSGRVLLDKTYQGAHEEWDLLIKADWPSAQSHMVSKATETMMQQIKADLAHLAETQGGETQATETQGKGTPEPSLESAAARSAGSASPPGLVPDLLLSGARTAAGESGR